MDFLIGERSTKLEYRYLRTASHVSDQERATDPGADEELFPVEVEDTCMIALATAYNARETEGGTTKQELLHFVEECFCLPMDKMKDLKESVRLSTSDRPELYLRCKVLCASGLIAKDAVDPFCRLGVINETHREKSIVKQKDLEHWRKEGLVENVMSTTVRKATSEPEWNEEFELSISDPSKEMLVLEVWSDEEPAEQSSTKSKGFRGLGLKKKSDGFIGRLFYPLRSIPNSGEGRALIIYDRPGKKEYGSVTLWFSIGVKEKKAPLEARLSDYTALTHWLVNFSAKKDGSYVRRWSGELPPMAEKLLEHHALLNNIDTLQQTCIRFSPLVKYHKVYGVNMKAIYSLIHKLKEYHVDFSITSTADDWKKQIFVNLSELSEEIQSVLMNHLIVVNISSTSGVAKIEERVKALCELFSFRPFTKQLPAGNSSLNTLQGTLEKCIRSSVSNWFRALDAQLQPNADEHDSDLDTYVVPEPGPENLAAFVSLSEHCLDQCQRTFKFLHPIFKEVGVDYFSAFFASLDKMLCSVTESRLGRCSQSSVSSTFAVYCSFKGMAAMLKHVDRKIHKDLTIPHFHKFFKNMVKDWIQVAIDKCKDYSVKAIAADSEITVTNDVMFSNSALDMTGFLLQFGSFWKNLEWPVAAEAYGYAISVVEGISECALFYVGEVFKKLTHRDMFDENGHFRATEKVCIVLNNMQHIRQELTQIEEKLELQTFYNWLETEGKLGTPFKEVVKNFSKSADEDIYNKMDRIMLEIAEKLSPDIQQFVHGIISSEADIKDEQAVDPLLEYLHRNLQTFVKHLDPAVLKIILNHMWRVSVDSVDRYLQEASLQREHYLQGPIKPISSVSPNTKLKIYKGTASKKKSTQPLHSRLFSALKTLGDSSDDKQAPVHFHERFVASMKSMGEAWKDSMDECYDKISDGLSLNPMQVIRSSVELHQRLFATLKTMREFYYCGGDGLDDETLDSERYKALYSKLDILRLPTEKLILRFFSDLAQRQCEEVESGKAELGTLLISVGYLKQSSVVDVDVIQGENFPGLERTDVKYLINGGLSDPFVQLTLMPSEAFAYDTKVMKTGVKNKNSKPFFNETFKLPAKLKEVDHDGTVLLMTVFDYNLIGYNKFVGMCVVACKDIPQLSSPESSLTDPSSAQQANLKLPLFRFTSETPAFVELDTRAGLGDEKANDFFKAHRYYDLLGDLHSVRCYASVLDAMSLPPMKKSSFKLS